MRLGSDEVRDTAHRLSIFHEEVIREEEGWLMWGKLDDLKDVSWSNSLLIILLIVLVLAPIPSSMGMNTPLSPVWGVEKEIFNRSFSGFQKTLEYAALPFRMVMRLSAFGFHSLSHVFPTLRSLWSTMVRWLWAGVKMPFYILQRICEFAFNGLRWFVSFVASLVCKCVEFIGVIFKSIFSFMRSVGMMLFGGSKTGSGDSGEETETGEVAQPGLVIKAFSNVVSGLRWIGQKVISMLTHSWRFMVFVVKSLFNFPIAVVRHSITGIKGFGTYTLDLFKMIYHGVGYVFRKGAGWIVNFFKMIYHGVMIVFTKSAGWIVDFFKMIYHGVGYMLSKVMEVIVSVVRFCWTLLRWIVNKSITLPLKGLEKVWCFLRWIGMQTLNGLRFIFSPIGRMTVWLKNFFFVRSPASGSTSTEPDEEQKPIETGPPRDGLFTRVKKFVVEVCMFPLRLLKFVWNTVEGGIQIMYQRIDQGCAWLKGILIGTHDQEGGKKSDGLIVQSWRFIVSVISRLFSWAIEMPKNIVLGIWSLLRSIFLFLFNAIAWVLEGVSGAFQWIFVPLARSPAPPSLERQVEERFSMLLERLEHAALMVGEGKGPCKCIGENGEEVQILDRIDESARMSFTKMDVCVFTFSTIFTPLFIFMVYVCMCVCVYLNV
jgi:hypothetical protein